MIGPRKREERACARGARPCEVEEVGGGEGAGVRAEIAEGDEA